MDETTVGRGDGEHDLGAPGEPPGSEVSGYPHGLPFEPRPVSMIPGAVLPHEQMTLLQEQLRAIDVAQSRAFVEGSTYNVT